MSGRAEFDEIRDLFRPLTRGAKEALGLADDVALIPGRPGFDLIISTDAIVEGVHALTGTSPPDLAFKLAGVSLSDLAAKGASPDGAFLNIAWPLSWTALDRRNFASGLGEALAPYNVRLFGGDTVSTSGPFQAALTVLGWAPTGKAVLRSGARAGQVVLVTGSVGDGWLGLAASRGEGDFDSGDREALALRYRRPSPRLAFSDDLRELASAAVDVSDGLIADLGHLAFASGVGVQLDLLAIPLSQPAQRWLARETDEAQAQLELAAGGDDYEVAFAADKSVVSKIGERAKKIGLGVTPVGRVVDGGGVQIMFRGRELTPKRTGWSHLVDKE